MDLILVRHAIAYIRDPMRWPDDSARPLTPDGVERFERSAAGLRQVAKSVDTVLSSPFVRAAQTAEILETVSGWPELVHCSELEPSREPSDVIGYLQQHYDSGVVALVGHEPLLGELAGALLFGVGASAQPIKKGGAVCLRSESGVGAGAMTLRWWLPPKITRKLGRA